MLGNKRVNPTYKSDRIFHPTNNDRIFYPANNDRTQKAIALSTPKNGSEALLQAVRLSNIDRPLTLNNDRLPSHKNDRIPFQTSMALQPTNNDRIPFQKSIALHPKKHRSLFNPKTSIALQSQNNDRPTKTDRTSPHKNRSHFQSANNDRSFIRQKNDHLIINHDLYHNSNCSC